MPQPHLNTCVPTGTLLFVSDSFDSPLYHHSNHISLQPAHISDLSPVIILTNSVLNSSLYLPIPSFSSSALLTLLHLPSPL